MKSFLDSFFKLKENNTNVKTEVMAGITTFMTMAYILIVNPSILSVTGMDFNALITATAIAAAIGTFFMAIFANYPFALAPGMGLNAYFAYVVVLQMGYSWEIALTAIFVEGIIFILLSFFNVREALFNAIPSTLKKAVGVGIGLFITFIGLQNAGVIVGNQATLVGLGSLKSITAILTLVGVIITVVMIVKKVRGAILWGILITYLLGLISQFAGIYVVNPDIGMYSLIPSGIISAPPSLEPIFFKFDFAQMLSLDFVIVIFTFLFVDLFDTLGTLIGVSTKAGFLTKEGKLPKIKQALLADAVATTAGAVLGTSTTTTYVESASGVADGGRTGLTAFTTGVLFILALVFSPVISVIPAFATAPALIVVGLFMMEHVVDIDFNDYTEALPAFLTILMMPLAYSISDGLAFGGISYVLVKLLSGKRKDIHPVMYIIALMFIVYFIF
ncbi:NCS2 family permease [Alkalibacter saccharofermentans]|uniref:Putative MFS transporter, AGZA family, xanthine/uracil permease n=1 Tax=Alkalibacter saccharofermentans DSM 14828 TaxID=1120975 RepID=A0A1M5A967_9FIRM|nr:NCS2 family permease [Alkalibacter saccharofermentans]SHF26715.1 putative MFS transporter, AGZA family, xanthine/uracil permease [Alkalibacter saccharofermentans DSM 14828]